MTTVSNPLPLQSLRMCFQYLRQSRMAYTRAARFWNQGFAFEAATAVLQDARERLRLERILAITSLDNDASIKLLQRLGFAFDSVITLPATGEQVKLFTVDISQLP